jgi:hypothetical protein
MKTHPENGALFAACNTPQEVIEALNSVTGFNKEDCGAFSPNSLNSVNFNKEMEALFR